jgi:methylated-DNA-protein-cysteine methyltransferase-like protein
MSQFFQQVYELVKKVPAGRVVTYGQIAKALGTRDARKVGWALHGNKEENHVPCHRVVNSAGRLAPNFAFDGPMEQRKRLEAEGVEFDDKGNVNLTTCQLQSW